jgi:hypothetical protein
MGFNFIRLVGFNYEPSFAAFGFSLFATMQILWDTTQRHRLWVNNKILYFGLILMFATQSLSVAVSLICFILLKVSGIRFLKSVMSLQVFLFAVFVIMFCSVVYLVHLDDLFNQRIEFWSDNFFFVTSQNYSQVNMFYESVLSWNFLSGPFDMLALALFGAYLIYRSPLNFPIIVLFMFSGFPIYTFSAQCLIALALIVSTSSRAGGIIRRR